MGPVAGAEAPAWPPPLALLLEKQETRSIAGEGFEPPTFWL